MISVDRFHQRLIEQYGCPLLFKTICSRERILHTKEDLGDEVKGMYVRVNGYSIIVLNSRLTRDERRDWAWHELWHHFNNFKSNLHYGVKEEKNATLFAALCRIPEVRWNETIESVVERCSVSPWLAKARIEFEVKKLQAV